MRRPGWIRSLTVRGRLTAAAVAGIYALLGGLWILLSDRALARLVTDPATQAQWQTYKGWWFVGGTALLLYVMVRVGMRGLERAAAATTEARRVTDSLLANLPGFVYRCRYDRDWTMTFVSDGCRALTGYTPQELQGNRAVSYAALIHPDDRERVWHEVEAAVSEQRAFQLTYRLVTKDGAERWVWEQGRLVATAPRATPDLEGLVIDISDWKALEDQLRQAQKLEAVGRLTAGIAHDFNNLLTVIIANAELAQAEFEHDPPALRDELREVQRAAQSASTLVKKLVGFSRQAPLVLKVTDLALLLRETTQMIRRMLPADIEVALTAAEAVPRVRVDPQSVQQMVLNLVTNARDAMPDGGRLTIGLEPAVLGEEHRRERPWVTPGAYVCLSVRDTGIGMDAATRERIFDPFFTTKPPGVGTGLGMAMIYGLIKQHRGHVHVYSELGQGTIVRLYFPVAVEQEPGPPDSGAPAPARGGTETVLVVEDDETLRHTTERSLARLGYTVVAVADGVEALDVLDGEHGSAIELVVSDVVLPNLNGPELYNAVRQRGYPVPFLFVSGYAAGEMPADLTAAPDAAFLQKPWSLAELGHHVRQLLDTRRGRPDTPQ